LKPILIGILFGSLTVTIYLLIIVITTPALPPPDAIRAAFYLNSPIIIGMGAGVGVQTFLSRYSASLGCKLTIKKKAIGGNSSGTIATSFFSFFSLVPLGCCGWWLYVISFLPSIFGTGVSAVLINYSQPLAYLGLVIIFVFNGLTVVKLIKEKKTRKLV
jgi:hypothetical protein